jgi:hypothetical protein
MLENLIAKNLPSQIREDAEKVKVEEAKVAEIERRLVAAEADLRAKTEAAEHARRNIKLFSSSYAVGDKQYDALEATRTARDQAERAENEAMDLITEIGKALFTAREKLALVKDAFVGHERELWRDVYEKERRDFHAALGDRLIRIFVALKRMQSLGSYVQWRHAFFEHVFLESTPSLEQQYKLEQEMRQKYFK